MIDSVILPYVLTFLVPKDMAVLPGCPMTTENVDFMTSGRRSIKSVRKY